jgi:hypothetical protein
MCELGLEHAKPQLEEPGCRPGIANKAYPSGSAPTRRGIGDQPRLTATAIKTNPNIVRDGDLKCAIQDY